MVYTSTAQWRNSLNVLEFPPAFKGFMNRCVLD